MSGSGEGMELIEAAPGAAVDGERAERRLDVALGERPERREGRRDDPVFDVRDLSVFYRAFRAVRDVTLPIRGNEITALIGPSGGGGATFLRCLNRMNDLIEGA